MIEIKDKSLCSGCHACASVCPKKCIEMCNDNEGFWYPKINKDNCINCNLCEKICPVLHDEHNKIKREPLAYAAYNKNEEIRKKSSSGGIFTLLAENIINKKGVVFGACFDENFNLVHDFAENISQLEKFRGSKYVQSEIANSYSQVKTFLDNGRLVLFTGTPCQVGGLKAYLRKDYDNLITQDLICHGVPSPKVFKKYVDYREKLSGSSTKKFSFREKEQGWKKYKVSLKFNDGTQYSEFASKDLMIKAFLTNVCLRPSCYNCKFKNINRQSDITLADFWGVEQLIPDMYDDKGTSLVIFNTNLGKNLLDEIKSDIIYTQADLTKAINFNKSMIKSVNYNKRRDGFLKEIDYVEFDKCVKKYCELSFVKKCVRFPIRVLSKIKRTFL